MTSYSKGYSQRDERQSDQPAEPVGSAGEIQIIHPLNGQQETRWCLLALLLILLAGGTGIWFNQTIPPEKSSHLELNTQDKAMLTSLSNAITEIRFFQQTDNQWPDIKTLEELMIPPFHSVTADYQWQMPDNGCYLGIGLQTSTAFLLMIPESSQSPGQIYTRQSGPGEHQDCHETEHWQLQITEF